MKPENSKTILLVEDDAVTALRGMKELVAEGYGVIMARSGEMAVEIVCLEKRAVDIILMDIDLGEGMDGTEASEIILRDHSIPIIFLTSHMEPEIIEKTERITSYGYVIKNLNPTILMVSIRMAFRLFDAKQELQRQKNEIHDLYNNAPCGYHTLAPDTTILSMNDTELRWLGYERHELVGRVKMTDLLPAENIEKFNRGFSMVKANSSINNYENTIMRKDGSLFHVLISANAVFDADGNFIMSRGTIMDNTERFRSAKLLREKERLYHDLFEKARSGKLLLDPENGMILDANLAAEEFYGYTREDLTRMNMTDINPIPLDELIEKMRGAMESKETVFKAAQRLADGSRRIVEIFSSPARISSRPLLLAIIHDVTKKSRLKRAASE